MDNQNKILSIVAYFLSKYDMVAVDALGYTSRTDAFRSISSDMGKNNQYLKLRRDEFDVLTDSHRKGWRNRKPNQEVLTIHESLKEKSFEDLLDLVISLIGESNSSFNGNLIFHENHIIAEKYSEDEIERILNFQDDSAAITFSDNSSHQRVYNKRIINDLKKLYEYKCQICGLNCAKKYGINIAEAHHIDYFSYSKNNNADNIVILCPNHHRIIHALNPTFEKNKATWIYPNGIEEQMLLNVHL